MGEIKMKNNVEETISDLKKVENPIVKAKKISYYLSDLLKQMKSTYTKRIFLTGR